MQKIPFSMRKLLLLVGACIIAGFIVAYANTQAATNAPVSSAKPNTTESPKPSMSPAQLKLPQGTPPKGAPIGTPGPDMKKTEAKNINVELISDGDTYAPGDKLKLVLRTKEAAPESKTNSATFSLEYNGNLVDIATEDIKDSVEEGSLKFSFKNIRSVKEKKIITLLVADMSKEYDIKNYKALFGINFIIKKDIKPQDIEFSVKAETMFDKKFNTLKINKGQRIVKIINISGNQVVDDVFTDIQKEHWAFPYVKSLYARGILKGMDKGIFAPSADVTRAQFATFIVKGLRLNLEQYNNEFKDVTSEQWFAKNIATAYKYGLIKGKGDGNFYPDQQMTREQMAVIIVSAFEKFAPNSNIQNKEAGENKTFQDVADISLWAKDNVLKARQIGIVSGIGDNSFIPLQICKREQMAVVIMKLMELCSL